MKLYIFLLLLSFVLLGCGFFSSTGNILGPETSSENTNTGGGDTNTGGGTDPRFEDIPLNARVFDFLGISTNVSGSREFSSYIVSAINFDEASYPLTIIDSTNRGNTFSAPQNIINSASSVFRDFLTKDNRFENLFTFYRWGGSITNVLGNPSMPNYNKVIVLTGNRASEINRSRTLSYAYDGENFVGLDITNTGDFGITLDIEKARLTGLVLLVNPASAPSEPSIKFEITSRSGEIDNLYLTTTN